LENLFLFALKASFFLPVLIVVRIFWHQKALNSIALAVAAHSLLFGLINIFHSSLLSEFGSHAYWIIYTALEFYSFSIIIFLSQKKLIKLATACTILFTINTIIQLLNRNSFKADSLNIGIESILISLNVIYFFYLRFKQVDEQYLYQNPHFWLMTGMLVYLGFTYFFNILVNHVDNEVIKNYYHYSYIGDIIKNVLFTVALLQIPRRITAEGHTRSFNAPNLDLI